MQFPGRAAAAIDCLVEIMEAGKPAEQVLTSWARAHRFAGSKDRRAIRDIVYRCLRQWQSFQALGFAGPRGAVAGFMLSDGMSLDDAFGAAPHGPDPLTGAEKAAIETPAQNVIDLQNWQIPLFEAALGRDTAQVLEDIKHRAPVYLRVNQRRMTASQAIDGLMESGIEAVPVPEVSGAVRMVSETGNVTSGPLYAEGHIEIQDLSSQRAIQMLPEGDRPRILDLCAGGGGKLLAAADRFRQAKLFAYDIDQRRMKDLPVRAERAGIAVTVLSKPPKGQVFDIVLVDAPCSGSGTWRRQPDAKWKLTQDRLKDLTSIQANLLDDASALVAPDGVLAYMTCSLFRTENEDQIGAFQKRTADWQVSKTHLNTDLSVGDGFFFALLRKNN